MNIVVATNDFWRPIPIAPIFNIHKGTHKNWLSALLCAGVVALAAIRPVPLVAQPLATNPLDARARPFIDRNNKELPMMVAPTLRQERTSVFNGVVTYVYTEVTKTAAELAPMNLAVTQRPYIFPAICGRSGASRMIRDGYSFRYLYFGKDGKLAAQLVIHPADCASIR